MKGDFDFRTFNQILKRKKITSEMLYEQLKKHNINISIESIKKYRQGKASPKTSTIYACSEILNIHMFELLEELGEQIESRNNLLEDIILKLENIKKG